jgi:hypothetical protein
MNEGQAPNMFDWRVKVGVGLGVASVVTWGILYDPELYIKVVAFFTMLVAVAFPLLYMTLPWKESILGRALMMKARAVALLYVVSILGFWVELPFKGYLMSLVTTYLAIGIGFQFIVLLRIKSRPDYISDTERLSRNGRS